MPVYLGALGPRMLRLAGEASDGAGLNWCTPEQIAWSRRRLEEGCARAGRSPGEVRVMEYIRMCVDEDVGAPGGPWPGPPWATPWAPRGSKAYGYRAHFTRMGFDEVLSDLEARRDAGATADELADACPDHLLSATSYLPPALRRLATGLDAIARSPSPARPEAVATMRRVRFAPDPPEGWRRRPPP